MKPSIQKLSALLLIPTLFMNVALANGPDGGVGDGGAKVGVQLPEMPPAANGEAVVDKNIKSVFVVARKIKGSKEDGKMLRNNELESLEVRFHLDKAHRGPDAYFEVYHRVPGKAEKLIGKLNYSDYQYTTGLLKRDYDKMWGEWIYAREGSVVLASGLSIYMGYAFVNFLSKRQWKLVSALAVKAIELHKHKFGFAIAVPLWLGGIYGLYKFWTKQANNIFYGREDAQRDWLHRVISQAYENARYGQPIDAKQFDVDAKYEEYMKTLTGKQAQAGEIPGELETEEPANIEAAPEVVTVPIKKEMKFATEAFSNFFKKYAEDAAEDDVPAN